MKKFLLFLAGALLICSSCEKASTKEDFSDLSARGNANCYLISKAGSYHFDAEVKGNGKEQLKTGSAGLVWESRPGMISEVRMAISRQAQIPLCPRVSPLQASRVKVQQI